MLICVPYFGERPEFLALLRYWFDQYEASGCTIPAMVIADVETVVPLEYPSLRVDTFPMRGALRGHPFDHKGAQS